jgi:HK97 family phage prohead protease
VFGTMSEDLGGFRETIAAGAFTRALAKRGSDPLALIGHRADQIIGRRSAGTLRLSQDSKGLSFEIDVPNTTTGRDLAVMVERGDLRHASFAFSMPAGGSGEKWGHRDGITVRSLHDVEALHEVSIVSTPAYPDTEVARRSLEFLAANFPLRLGAVRRFLETVI